MFKMELDSIFESFSKNVIFRDKSILQTNYVPKEILYRDNEIKQIASILAPVLRGEKPSNLFLYGKTGTGKTLSIQYIQKNLINRVKEGSDFKLRIEYVNCKLKKVSDTEYRILAELIKKLGGNIPATGLPTESVYNKFIELIDSEKQLVVLILDEIDQTVKKISDNFLYNLTRLNSELSKTRLSVVGISNDLTFLDNIDPRVKSSLSEEEIVFPPYNAVQLREILKMRSKEVFKQGVMQEGVIEKCAGFAAREHGDARRALDLLRIAGELSERDGSKKITIKHIDEANSKIERDKILETISTSPKQFQIVLYSIINLAERKNKPQKSLLNNNREGTVFTGEVYGHYQKLCSQNNFEVLTSRRVNDIIHEFMMLGIIDVKIISKGRGGRMSEIKLTITESLINKAKKLIEDSLNFKK
ncbi:orc1/cdc6 family replication initiation protein [Candidatus Pacearchaeota archaeon]|nr:orc1/cdc6 family replication initiation protein [Candidatus Pacearchaeota archaeon]